MKASSKVLGIFILICSLVSIQCGVTKTASIAEEEDTIDYYVAGRNLSNLQLDNIGNLFVVKNNRVLQKYNKEATLQLTYDNQNDGFITSVDAQNPLYILVFYYDASRIKILDRNLAELHSLDLNSISPNDFTAASLSNDNQIWLYDNTERKLKKVSIQGKPVTESLDLYGMTSVNTNVSLIKEHGNSVFLRNIEGKLIVLDNLAQYKKDYDVVTGIPLSPRTNQICCPMEDGNYNCIRLDDNPFQQVITVSKLESITTEAFLYQYNLFQLVPGGVLKLDITKK